MSDFQQQPDPNRHTFCQICGRTVATEADRLAGKAFPCGLCNEVKLAAPASTGYVYPGTEVPFAPIPGAVPPPTDLPPIPPVYPRPDAPNPALAGLLGLIPGVGAMYNGQYAKGLVHLVIFAVLASLGDSAPIFGFLAFVWVCYQAVEAHHTARARRDGTPLPNPFGLNDIGERLGFGKGWPTSAPPPAGVPPVVDPTAPPTANWGGPWEAPRYTAPYTPPPMYTAPPPVPPYPPYVPVGQAADAPGYPPYAPYDPTAAYQAPFPPVRHRFPAGAIWLIALGTLFLLNTSGIFHGFPSRIFLPILFIGLGVWTFVRKMTDSGLGLADDGSHEYRFRLFRAARASVWLLLLGVIFFLAEFDILSWGRSWPLFLILAGVMTFLERLVQNNAAAVPPPSYPPGYYPPAPVPPVATTTALVPTHDDLKEGR